MKKRTLFYYIISLLFVGAACHPGSSDIHTLTSDGAWCWFSDPRGVRAGDNTFIGWVNSDGDIVLSAWHHRSGKLDTTVIQKQLEVDDHDNPSILVRDDGRILVFYSKHGTGKFPIILRVSENPGDISAFGPEQRLVLNDTLSYPSDYRNAYTYTNPYQLSGENNRIYLFWRGMGNKPNVSYSDDYGTTWAPGKIMIHPQDIYAHRRPYLKVASNGTDKIHLAFTDGHPHREPQNSIYYAYYQKGAFYTVEDSKICDFESLPFAPRQASVVYDATKTNERAWVWDVAEDQSGHPVIVYARFPDNKDHRYYYARWDGDNWLNVELCSAGKWFPQTQEGKEEREPNYSGGLVLDHSNPSVVYLSREINGVFEIEKWSTDDGGKSWESEPVTRNSVLDNVRPFVVRNSKEGDGPHVVWMQNRRYTHYTDYSSFLKWK